ncbi:MAG: hypothetical protein ABIN96_16470 [Rubrivivax sp.]
MDLKVPIAITDELTDEVITATGALNLASGEIDRVEYPDYDAELHGTPIERSDYEFSSGTLSSGGKDVEFKIDVNRTTGQYSVSASELLEIKVRAAALFAGFSGKDLATQAQLRHPLAPGAVAAGGAGGVGGVGGAAAKGGAAKGGGGRNRLH